MFKNNSKNEKLDFDEVVFDDVVYSDLDYLELPTSRQAFLLIAGCAVLIASLVLGRVAFLNFFNGVFYQARASANISHEISLPVFRAVIEDRFGQPLVKNTNSFSVVLNLGQLIKNQKSLEPIITELAGILEVPESDLIDLTAKTDLNKSNWLTIARNITPQQTIAIKGLNQDFIQIINDYRRIYLDGPVFADIIGYTGLGSDNSVVGKSGLEFQYNDSIKGQEGKYALYEDATGKILSQKVVSESKPGAPLQITIDAELQKYFYSRLQEALRTLNRESGVGIAVNPQTGEVLAMVSFPSFDNNAFVDASRNSERKVFLTSSAKPLFNRAISGLYSPGSTIKPLVALSALHEGVVDPESQIFSAGYLKIPNPYQPDLPSVFLDWKKHGWVNLATALARSSNVYFYLLGGGLPQGVPETDLINGKFVLSGLGIGKLHDYWQKFNLGSKTGIDLPFESQGFLPDPQEKQTRTNQPWRLGDTYNVSIGQGDLQVTPLQLLNFIASVGNGGKIYRPFINKNLEPQTLADYSSWQSELKAVQYGLEQGVQDPAGSSHLLNSLPFKVAGKTGTPQISNNVKVNAFFSGYGPVDDPRGPQIAILVFVENAVEGSLNALPVAKDVFQWYYENRIQNSTVNP